MAAIAGMTLRRAPAKSGARHGTGAPVLRDSIEAGTFEETFFAVPAKGETDRLLHVARRTLDAAKRLRRDERTAARSLSASERIIARLTAGAVRVYEEILTLSRLNRGRVYPSYDHLTKATALGRATVARALKVLEAIGFLVRQRRFVRVKAEGPGPRYEQTSNAYRPLLPSRVLSYLPRWMRPAPLPADEVQRRADHAGELGGMMASLSCRELAEVTVGGQLGKMLAKLGAAVDQREREYQNDPQPLPESYSNGRVELA
ncbi:helix-turn-helix domain-containing protein [Sphingomonas sp. VNH70]|uniref:helix-turn-helix domain-containing protein n=1 Tax=Sphingomonas silueang TaxID=3156617 RepID=UPI0032B5C111